MCGIAGFISISNNKQENKKLILERMTSTLSHRGPDDGGTWWSPEDGIALGHRRLAILDLSPAGKQPMTSGDGRFVTVYNGEIYNFREIRRELEKKGHTFSTNCDTEVLLASFSEWGPDCISRFIGMFAFAIWDKQKKRLHLVRDRLGIKPLYYGWSNEDNSLVFASELKAICTYPGFNNPVDLNALSMFFRHNYIPAPFTIYEQVFKLMPGQVLTLEKKNLGQREVEKHTYWSAFDAWKRAKEAPFEGSDQEAVDHLERTLLDSVRLRLITDVPLGAFLSGGIDSSTVVALMQTVSTKPVRTFSIGFRETQFNEAPYARQVAKHLGTEHTELYVTGSDALDLVPKLPEIWDEPFADSSQIPTLLISSMTRKHVTVALSGDGGDELFWGYPRYKKTLNIWKLIQKLPCSAKGCAADLLPILPDALLDGAGRIMKPLLEKYGVKNPLSRVSRRIRELLCAQSFESFYGWANSHMLPFGPICQRHDLIAPIFDEKTQDLKEMDKRELMSLLDILTYLPDDILTKVDRASMAVALETRVPILDHRVVELAFALPGRHKFRHGRVKWILRQLLYRYVPQKIVDRPKMGFGIPLGQWLRGPLRNWAQKLIEPDRLKQQGYLNAETVSRIWAEHLSGKCNHKYILWNILMFQAWYDRWIS